MAAILTHHPEVGCLPAGGQLVIAVPTINDPTVSWCVGRAVLLCAQHITRTTPVGLVRSGSEDESWLTIDRATEWVGCEALQGLETFKHTHNRKEEPMTMGNA